MGGFQGWVERLHAQGRRVDDLILVGPAEGMDLSFAEILRVYEWVGIASSGKVFRGADRHMEAPGAPVPTAATEAIIDLAKTGDGPHPSSPATRCITFSRWVTPRGAVG